MKEIQNYIMIKKLGEGSFGETFLAEKDHQKVVIKRLKLGEIDQWKTIKRFHREAKILKKLDYPAIPDYIDFIEEEQFLGIVQQYIPGESLHQLIEKDKRFTTPELVDILKQGLDILTYLQGHGIIHRDINPKNILLDPSGKLWFVDFGAVQQIFNNQNSTITTMGTFGYMAPEQILGKATTQSDLFSFGMSMIALISGKPIDQLPQDLMSGLLAQEVFSGIPPQIQKTLEKIVQPGIKKRFQTASEASSSISQSRSHQKDSVQSLATLFYNLKRYHNRDSTAYILQKEQPNTPLSSLVTPRIVLFLLSMIIELILINLIITVTSGGDPWSHIIITTIIILLHNKRHPAINFPLNSHSNLHKRFKGLKESGYILYKTDRLLTLEYHHHPVWELSHVWAQKAYINKIPEHHLYEAVIVMDDKPHLLYFSSQEAAEAVINDIRPDLLEKL